MTIGLLKRLTAPAFIAAVAAGCTCASGATKAAQRQSPATFAEAKAILLKNGFEPAPMRHDEDELLCGDDHFCRDHPEVFYCSGVGINVCDFAYYRKADRRWLVLETFGEKRLTAKEVRPASPRDLQMIEEHQAARSR